MDESIVPQAEIAAALESAQAQPETPTPAPAPVATTLQVAVPESVAASNDLQAVLSNISDPGALDAILYGNPNPAANPAPAQPAATPAPAPAVPSTPVAQEPAPAQPAAQEPNESTPDANGEPKILPSRISTAQFDPREKQAIALKHELEQQGVKIDLLEAMTRVNAMYGTPANPAATTVQPQTPQVTTPEPVAAPVVPAPVSPVQGNIEALEAEVNELEQQIIEDGANQNLSSAEIAKAKVEHARKVAELTALKLQANQAVEAQRQAQQSQFKAQYEANMNEVLREYPDAGDEFTYLGSRITAVVAEINQTPNHPNAHLLTGTDAPRKITEFVANQLAQVVAQRKGVPIDAALAEVRGKAAAPAAPAQAPAPAAPRPVPRTIGVSTPGSNAAPAQAPQVQAQDLQRYTNENPDAVFELLGFGTYA